MAESTIPEGLDPKLAHVVNEWENEHPLITCRFDPLGRYVFCGAESGTAARFALADGKRTPLAGGHESWVFAIAGSKDGRWTITGGGDGKLVWWETAADEPKPARTVEAHSGWIRSMDVSPDGLLLVTGGNDRVVRLWNTEDGALVRELPAHPRDVYCVKFHPSGQFVLSGDLTGVLKQWDTSSGQEVRAFDAKALHSYNGGQMVDFGGIRGISVSPDLAYVAAGGLHKATNPLGAVHEPLILLFQWSDAALARSHIAEGITQGVIWGMAHLADGTLVGASGGGNGGFLVFWKPDADKDFHRFQLPNIVRDMHLAPDGLRVATAHHDKKVRITRLAAKQA